MSQTLFARCIDCGGKGKRGAYATTCQTCTGTGIEPATPRQSHSETSGEAATVAQKRAPRLRRAVLDYLREHGPRTDEQIAHELQINPSSARPRRVELVDLGLVEQAGYGTTSAGRRASLWQAK